MAAADGRILTSEIISDDNLDSLIAKMKVLEGSVTSLTDSIRKNETAASELESTTRTLNTSTAAGREQIVKAAKSTDEIERAHRAYTKALSDETAKVQELKLATATITNLKKNEAKAALAAEGSYNKLSAQYSIIKLTLNAMSSAEREGTAEGKKLVKTANEIYQEMKRLQAETGKTALNVGNYSEAVQMANQNLGEMRKELMALKNVSFAGKTEEEIAQINQRIGTLVDNMDDLRAQQKALGTEMSTLFVGSLKVVSAGVEGLVGTLSLLGVESESLQNLERKMIQLIAVTHALSEIEDALQKKTIQTTFARVQAGLVTAKDTVLKAANVFATNAAARAEDAKAIAMSRGNIVTRAAATVQWLWNAALAANPIGLVVVAIAALAAGIVLLIRSQRTQTDEMRKAAAQQKVNNELTQQAAINAVEEKIQVGNLIGILKSETATKKEKKQAIEQLNEIAPEYFKGLTIEKDGVEALAKAYTDKYLPALEKRAKFEAANQKLIEIEKKLLDTQTRLAETKPTYLDAAIALTKNLGDKVAATKDLTDDWTESLEENKQGLEDEKEAVLNFIKTNDLATQVLDYNTASTKANTKAKKEGLTEAEKIAIEANKQLGFMNELRDLEESGIVLSPDRFYAIGRNIGAALGDGLGDAKPLQNIFDANAEKDIKRRGELIGKSAGDGLKSGIGESLSAFERLAQGESIYDLLGLDIDDKDKTAIKSTFDFAKQQLTDFLNFRTEIANRNVANADREVQAAQAALDNQITLQAAGLANTVQSRQMDLADAKRRQDEALKRQEIVARQEQLIAGAQQAANLALALSKLFATNPILAIGLGALMIGSFVGFKIAAANASKRQYGEGDLQVLRGGSHASGNDIPLGTTDKQGRHEHAEGGEARMILSKSATSKYRSILPEIFQALKQKDFENQFQRIGNASAGIPLIVNVGGGNSISTGRMERTLDLIHRQGQEKTIIDGRGRMVTTYKNLTTVREL